MRKVGFVLLAVVVVGCQGPMGPEGPPGPAGSTGATGPIGPKGADGTAQSGRFCDVISGGWYFSYQVVSYAGGDKLIFCSISTNKAQYSNSVYYDGSVPGAQDEGCLLTTDADSIATGGYWTFTNEGAPKAVYTDSTSDLNGDVVIFAANDCITF